MTSTLTASSVYPPSESLRTVAADLLTLFDGIPLQRDAAYKVTSAHEAIIAASDTFAAGNPDAADDLLADVVRLIDELGVKLGRSGQHLPVTTWAKLEQFELTAARLCRHVVTPV